MNNKITRSALAVAIGSAISMGAQADILISEYIEGSSFNKAIEIANTGTEAVTLNGYVLKTKKNGLGDWQSDHDLSGVTIPANDVYVLTHPSANDAIKAVSDATASIINHNGDETYMLFKDGNPHDNIGTDGDVDWGKDKTFVRKVMTPAAIYDASMWDTFAKDNSDNLGIVGEGAEPPPPFSCTTEDGSEPTFTAISDIQGDGDKSPLIESGYITEEDYFVKGIVTARGESLFKGFYLSDINVDGDDNTSDGLFVHTGDAPSSDIQPGAIVCVKGKVQEYYDQTQLSSANDSYKVTGSSEEVAPVPLVIKEGETLRDALERHEGMEVVLNADSDLYVTRNFSYDYAASRNNMVLAHKSPLFKPTQLHPAESDEAVALTKENAERRVFVESDYKAASGKIPYYPTFGQDMDQDGSSESHIRLGSRVEQLEAMVAYSYGEYRLVATNEITKEAFVTKAVDSEGKVLFDVQRTDAPAVADSDLRVASFNVLNYFTSVADGGASNPTGSNRGATNNEEFLVQQAKIVEAMTKMDADIIGLMEIENNGFGDNSAINNLITALNSKLDEIHRNKTVEEQQKYHYTYVEIEAADKYQDEYLGSDAIMVALLYRASEVELDGAAQVIITPEQHVPANTQYRTKDNGELELNPAYDKYQRHSLLQTFKLKHNDESLSVVVNHLKSKGSECFEEWATFDEDSNPAHLQGNCNNFRVSAVKAIGDHLAGVKGDILVMGDMNAYGMEDPMLALTDYSEAKYGRTLMTASHTTLGVDDKGEPVEYEKEGSKITQGYGYINLNTKLHGADTFSYTYEGELGNLDHALANSSLADKVVAIEDWHINASESNLFEYSSKYTGDMVKYNDQFSASDHDPIIIAIDLPEKDLVLPEPGEQFTVEYTLPSNAVVGDIVKVTLSESAAEVSAQSTATPYEATATLTQNDVDAKKVDVVFKEDIPAGNYEMTETLTDASGTTVKESETRSVSLSEQSATPAPVEEDGGSFGFGGLLALAGLAFWRRRR